LSPYQNYDQAFNLFKYAKDKFGQPNSIVSDQYSPYNIPGKIIFP